MNIVTRTIGAIGIALQSFADAVATPLNVAATPDITPSRNTVSDDVVNPYVDQDTSEWLYETLENGVQAAWPILAIGEVTDGMDVLRSTVHASLELFTGQELDDERGMYFEIARLCNEYLPADQDPDALPASLYVDSDDDDEDEDVTVVPVEAEVAAFFDAAISGEFLRAVAVTEAMRLRFKTLPAAPGEEVECAAVNEYAGVLAFAAALLGNLSRQWSVNTFDDLLSDAVAGDDD